MAAKLDLLTNYLRKTKTFNSRQIPISDRLDRLFKSIRKREHLRSEFVFTYTGNRLTTNHKAFHTALRRADIDDFRFHDLRHTFASQVLLKGGSLKDIQELLGHKDVGTTMIYTHVLNKGGQGVISPSDQLQVNPNDA